MNCWRCDGLMVADDLVDMEDGANLWLRGVRCVICGEVLDRRILGHRILQHPKLLRSIEMALRKPRKRREPVKVGAR